MKNFRITIPDNYYQSESYKNLLNKKYLNENPAIIQSRSFDGISNNITTPQMGSSGMILLRKVSSAYADGIGSLVERTSSPRVISNNICASETDIPNIMGLSNMCWMWGQFIDHEIDITPTDPTDVANMITPNDDVYPNRVIPFTRSVYNGGVNTPREQLNNISCFIDATNVYGFNNNRSICLRRLDGSGKLSTLFSDNNQVIPIYNLKGLENAAPHGSNPSDFFLCGDVRANENLHLTAMHTLFIREHNRLCDLVIQNNPKLTNQDELIYQQARRILYGEMQQITYKEFLPALLGKYSPKITNEYNKYIDPGILTEFSTVGYRFGHSLLPNIIKLGVNETIELKDAFFNPGWIQQNGIDKLIVGAVNSNCDELNVEITNAVRNFLFGPPSAEMLLDLASLNIQRGRDHGIPDYNTVRQGFGLQKITAFSQITANISLQNKLALVYETVDDIDPWVGCLAEDHLPTAAVGPLIKEILCDQFTRLMNCDRFWWDIYPGMTDFDKNIISTTTLSKIIKRNVSESSGISDDVFHI